MFEKEAEEYLRKHWSDNVTEMNNQYSFQQVKGAPHFYDNAIKQAFFAGLKAGRPQWHDLREDPEDLPERISTLSRTVVNQIGTPCHYNYDLGHWVNWSYIEIETPIAWCEIPTFDKE